ncbi:MAG: hypothetical protein WA061_01790 [Microgenomates group bacterium]
MTVKNNYGKWLDSEIPSPGVISFNKLNYEYLSGGEEICLDCEEIIECNGQEVELISQQIELEGRKENPSPDMIDDWMDEIEDIENGEWDCFEHTKLIGDWKKDDEGLYIPDEEGEFAAKIDSQNDVVVLWSKFTTRGTPCSPCAPWGVSIGTDGDFMCYTLPEYLIYKGE